MTQYIYHVYSCAGGRQVVAYNDANGYYWSDYLPHPAKMPSDTVEFLSKREALEVVSKMEPKFDSYGIKKRPQEHLYMKIPVEWLRK